MKSTVKITKNPNTNEVFTLNTNPDGSAKLSKDGQRWGTIRVEQLQVVKQGNILTPKPVSALISISEEGYKKASSMLTEGAEFGGQIIRKETTETQKDGSPLLGWREKRAGSDENAPVCKVNGKTIYQQTIHTDDLTLTDELIAHDNAEEIKAFQAKTKAAMALNG
jgi:hypothetical protein